MTTVFYFCCAVRAKISFFRYFKSTRFANHLLPSSLCYHAPQYAGVERIVALKAASPLSAVQR